MVKIVNNNKQKLILLIVTLSLLIISYIGLVIYNIHSLKQYDEIILPNIYIEEFDFSGYSFKNSEIKIDFYTDYILSKKINLKINTKTLSYSLKELAVTIDKDKTIQELRDYQKNLSYTQKLKVVNNGEKKEFKFIYKIDDNKLRESLESIKEQTNVNPINGYFNTENGVSYIKGTDGYTLDVEKSFDIIKEILEEGKLTDEEINLTIETIPSNTNENYQAIDTMTSSFVTTFMPNTYLRNINLDTALSYINGSIVEPGDIFSYCDKAGPFNKEGYVFYYEFVGNGVCQIATTTYNAALLGGLEIVKRYPHAKKSVYVDGGLDATVASYTGGWCVDMQFKNTYNYPIYIKAYSQDGQAHVEFWSNKDAKEGKEYQTESVKIGVRGYRTFLHTYKDGVEINNQEIATTWYTEE